jgi:hypothetical protein
MNKIKIYHYSNADIKDYINSSFFGINSYSNNSKNISKVNRSYFYRNLNNREYYFNGVKFLYTAKINLKDLYNIDRNLFNNSKDIYLTAKNRGYRGIYNNEQVILFNKIKIIKKEVL